MSRSLFAAILPPALALAQSASLVPQAAAGSPPAATGVQERAQRTPGTELWVADPGATAAGSRGGLQPPRGGPDGSLTALRGLCDDLNARAALAEANRRTQQ